MKPRTYFHCGYWLDEQEPEIEIKRLCTRGHCKYKQNTHACVVHVFVCGLHAYIYPFSLRILTKTDSLLLDQQHCIHVISKVLIMQASICCSHCHHSQSYSLETGSPGPHELLLTRESGSRLSPAVLPWQTK